MKQSPVTWKGDRHGNKKDKKPEEKTDLIFKQVKNGAFVNENLEKVRA